MEIGLYCDKITNEYIYIIEKISEKEYRYLSYDSYKPEIIWFGPYRSYFADEEISACSFKLLDEEVKHILIQRII